MSKSRRGKQRLFRRAALAAHAVAALRPRMGPGETLWQFTVVVPLEEIKPLKRQKATAADLDELQRMFAEDFGGFSRAPNSVGYGLRDPSRTSRLPEMNYNATFTVLASPIPEADRYFRALREELEDALQEGVILVERQEVWIP